VQTAQVQFTTLYSVARVYNRTTETGANGHSWGCGGIKTTAKTRAREVAGGL